MYLKGKIDLHMHTTVSDGSDSPEEILQAVKTTGLLFFAVSDHDAVKSCRIVRGLLREGDPAFVNGAEFSCRDELGKYHILGYAYDPAAAAMMSYRQGAWPSDEESEGQTGLYQG